MNAQRNALSIAALLYLLSPICFAQKLKVFVLAGQSNMQGHASISTFDSLAYDPKTAPFLREMRGPDGAPRVCEDVWISSIGSAEEERIGRLTTGFGADQRGPKIVLRWKLADLVYQEIWGYLCCHYAIRTLMFEAADHANVDTDRVSFVATLRIARRSISQARDFSPSRP